MHEMACIETWFVYSAFKIGMGHRMIDSYVTVWESMLYFCM